MAAGSGAAPWKEPLTARQAARGSLIVGGVGVGFSLALLAAAFGATGLATGRQASPRQWRWRALRARCGLLSLGVGCFWSAMAWYWLTEHYP